MGAQVQELERDVRGLSKAQARLTKAGQVPASQLVKSPWLAKRFRWSNGYNCQVYQLVKLFQLVN